MLQKYSVKFALAALTLLTVGCKTTFITTPLKEKHLSRAEAGLGSSYDMVLPASQDQGELVIGQLSIVESTDRKIALVYQITDQKSRKDAEKIGKIVQHTMSGSLVRVAGQIVFEADESANSLTGGPAYSLSAILRSPDASGAITVLRLEVKQPQDKLVTKIPSKYPGVEDSFLIDNSQMSSEQLAGMLTADPFSGGLMELRLRKD